MKRNKEIGLFTKPSKLVAATKQDRQKFYVFDILSEIPVKTGVPTPDSAA